MVSNEVDGFVFAFYLDMHMALLSAQPDLTAIFFFIASMNLLDSSQILQ